MKKLKKQIIGVTMFSLICSLVLGCVLGLAVTSVMCFITLYVTGDSFILTAWLSKLSEMSAYIFIYSYICMFIMDLITVLMYKVNTTLWDKVHRCKNDEEFTIMKLIPDVKKYVLIFEKIGSVLSKAY